MNLFRLWLDGILRPLRMASRLSEAPAPQVGLAAVLIRFVTTSATSLLALYLLSRLPFAPSELVELPIEKYYLVEMFFLPLWGLAIWILMGSVVYLSLRFSSAKCDFDKILNIFGLGMLVPMPFLWLWDWSAIALNIYTITNQAITHSIAQIWEAAIEIVCFLKVLRLRPVSSIALVVIANAIYIALAMHFIR
jgi:hypothetical protein